MAIMPRARFHTMCEGTKEDWALHQQAMKPFIVELPDRVLAHLRMLRGRLRRLRHRSAGALPADGDARASDGRDEEYVVCALLHDMGDILGPRNHADVAAAILKPFVSEQNHWMVEKHAIFQGYYFFHHLGLDRNMREQFRDHPWYACTEEFCRAVRRPGVRSALRQPAARGLRADGAARVLEREELDLRAESDAPAAVADLRDD